MNRLERHEKAQNASRRWWESQGYLTLSFATTECADFLCLSGDRFPVAVEIKTGEGRLSPVQRTMLPKVAEKLCLVWVEHWRVTRRTPPELVDRLPLTEELKPKRERLRVPVAQVAPVEPSP